MRTSKTTQSKSDLPKFLFTLFYKMLCISVSLSLSLSFNLFISIYIIKHVYIHIFCAWFHSIIFIIYFVRTNFGNLSHECAALDNLHKSKKKTKSQTIKDKGTNRLNETEFDVVFPYRDTFVNYF